MEADFSGYATKAGLKCADGRTIMPGAFKQQDKVKVPLVWQHAHSDPENVLGHAILEDRDDGTYTYGFFNKSAKATHAKTLLEHGDITRLSIWANELVERSGRVLHGAIREVSLVLSGANPGALIENVTIRHSDGDDVMLDDEVIIYTGIDIEHSSIDEDNDDENNSSNEDDSSDNKEDSSNDEDKDENSNDKSDSDDSNEEEIQHADSDDETVQDIYESMTEKQQNVLYYMIEQALVANGVELKQDNLDDDNTQKGSEMAHNVFEKKDDKPEAYHLTHADVSGIVADATKLGSLKDAVENFAISHGIEDIDVLFPDAKAVTNVPEFLQRRTEWVAKVLGSARKSPFSRIKTLSADLTVDEARAKGYITGTLKKEEFFGVAKRITTPTTVYKKQKLDRDDMIDITDFDVVAWLKSEMRLMLDEEIARAILIGDGRDVANEDKINEQNIRPIANDHELYATVVNINVGDANSSIQEVVDALIMNRHHYKGTGLPTMYTTETVISQFMLLKDTLGRRIYKSLDEVANELRVSEIVSVEVMEEEPDVMAILVNMNDYVVGATAGGQVSMFDDFDIDYNQYKYLIETRMSGALTKLKSAIVVKRTAAGSVLVTPTAPTFDGATVTIPVVTGAVYKDSDGATLTGTAPVPSGESLTVVAEPAAGHHFATSEDDTWTFTNNS